MIEEISQKLPYNPPKFADYNTAHEYDNAVARYNKKYTKDLEKLIGVVVERTRIEITKQAMREETPYGYMICHPAEFNDIITQDVIERKHIEAYKKSLFI
jgi:hypothetical protein